MIRLLQSQGFVIQSRISGRLAYDTILQNADTIEEALRNPPAKQEVISEPEPEAPEEVVAPIVVPPPPPLEEWQCDSTPLAEAEERLRFATYVTGYTAVLF